MKRLINLTAIHSLIALPILVILLISQPSESTEEKGIANWQVHSACKDALEHEDDSVRKTANFVCRILTDMIYEANYYHEGYINYFTDEGWEDAVKFAESGKANGFIQECWNSGEKIHVVSDHIWQWSSLGD